VIALSFCPLQAQPGLRWIATLPWFRRDDVAGIADFIAAQRD